MAESTTLPEQTGTAAPAAVAAPADTSASPEQQAQLTPEGGQPAQEQTTDQGKPKEGSDQAYIRRLQAQRAKARAEVARIARENEELRNQVAKGTQGKPADGPPKRDQFDDYEAFLSAQAEYAARTASQKYLDDQRQAQTAEQQRRQAAEMDAAWSVKLDKARDDHADFDEATAWLPGQIPQAVLPVLADSDMGANVLYYLGTHPEELERIQAMTPMRQIREVIAMEAKVKPAPKKTTAPPPIEPVKGSAPGGIVYSKDMSQEDYAKLRAARLGRKIV